MHKFKSKTERQMWIDLIDNVPTHFLHLSSLTDEQKIAALANHRINYADAIIKAYRERNDDFS